MRGDSQCPSGPDRIILLATTLLCYGVEPARMAAKEQQLLILGALAWIGRMDLP